jgi:hypothetical protein
MTTPPATTDEPSIPIPLVHAVIDRAECYPYAEQNPRQHPATEYAQGWSDALDHVRRRLCHAAQAAASDGIHPNTKEE